MGSRKKRGSSQTTSSSATPEAGIYSISTGEVELKRDPYGNNAWEIYVNGVPSSHINTDPSDLAFEYMRWMTACIQDFLAINPPPYSLRVTHLGGGACSLARWFVATYPGSKNTVIEVDATLATLVRDWFNLPKAPRLKIRVADAAVAVRDFREASRDIIIRDVFAPDTTPRELCTLEFHQQCAASLEENGIYVANCGDHRDLTHARSELATMAKVYPHLAAVADPAMLKGRRYGNIVLLGSKRPIEPSPSLERILRTDPIPAGFRDHEWCLQFANSAQPYLSL
ncbi:MAG: fused MFS/spermidine synthase [Corynebacterium sp.]|nr:fused MFS/spermidine synthase [Corynebacterium sp.]